jgi:glyoxylase-like metal-dependent hydrolase (beta-lactamase superfamily II)
VIGVGDRLVLVAGKLRLEIGAPPGNAHTSSDLYVFDAVTRTAFVGDLVTPDRCPMLSDPDSDIKGWIVALDRLEALKPVGLVGSRGNPTPNAGPEIGHTRHYLTALLQFLVEKKKQNAPEARVSGELAGEKLGDYCPRELSAINALSVYRRIGTDGSTLPGSALPPKTAPK